MSVWIVIVNDKVDAVFDSMEAAEHHRLAMQQKWNIARVIEMEVRSL